VIALSVGAPELEGSRVVTYSSIVEVHGQGAGSTGTANSAVTETTADEPISPELALVDPELARWARASLGQHELPWHRVGPAAEPSTTAASRPVEQRHTSTRDTEAAPFRPPRNRCIVPSLLSGLLGALIVALAISFKSTPGYYLPPVPSTDSGAATQPPDAKAPKTTTGASAPSKAVRVNWTPERGAVGYEVALVRGSRTLYRAYSLQASLELPARWSFGGRDYALDPGVYKWLVWPVRAAGSRDASPSVRRTLIVPGTHP